MPIQLDVTLTIRRSERIPPSCLWCPVELKGLDVQSIERLAERRLDPAAVSVVQLNEDGTPVIFDADADADGEDRFSIPCRFDPDYGGCALPLELRTGTLVWPARTDLERQRFRVSFPLAHESTTRRPRTLVGDGDMMTQRVGRLAVSASSRPVEYGSRLFGRPGLIVGSYLDVRFFEDAASGPGEPLFRDAGRLLDVNGDPLAGVPYLGDLEGSGRLGFLMGRHEGDFRYYRNEGTNEAPRLRNEGPVRHADGSPIDMREYLRDVEAPIMLRDGSLDPNRTFRPVAAHFFPVSCALVDWLGEGRRDLIACGWQWLFFFRRSHQGFERGVMLRNADGAELRPGSFLKLVDWNEDGRPDLLIGDYHGYVRCVEFCGVRDDLPVLRDRGRLQADGQDLRDIEYSSPCVVDWRGDGEKELLVGNFYGEICRYRSLGNGKDGKPELARTDYLQAVDAYATRYMEPSIYADVNGDGNKALLSGDIKGGVYYYPNSGTNRRPVFESCRPLCDENGPIKIDGGPDPNTPDDGYTKPALCHISGQTAPDLLLSSGLGRVWYFERAGADREGSPRYKSGCVLRDVEGNEVRANHMSAIAVADWDHDGTPDLIVAGQKDVHGKKDDDPDETFQVRWFRGLPRDEAGRLRFAPYVGMIGENDTDFYYRPKPCVIDWWGEEVLYVTGRLYRRAEGDSPHTLRHVTSYPRITPKGRERFVPADYSFNELAPGDPLVIVGSCVGSIYAFREAFVFNGGYLAAQFDLGPVRKDDGTFLGNPSVRGESEAVDSKTQVARDVEFLVPRLEASPSPAGDYDDPSWRGALEISTFYHAKTRTFHQVDAVASGPTATRLKLAWDADALNLIVWCGEPEMERLVSIVDHDNGILDQKDDHVVLTLDPEPGGSVYHRWFVSARGFVREVNVDRASGMEVGPWTVGKPERILVATRWLDKAHTIQLRIPFDKLGVTPQRGERWTADLVRARKVYADARRASESSVMERTRWRRNAANASEPGFIVFV